MPDLDFVYLVGRFGLTVGDGPDPGEEPDTIYIDEGTVSLEPVNTYTKVAGSVPLPSTLGQSTLPAGFDTQGYLTWRGVRRVLMVDLTSDKVNPHVDVGRATHRVTFRGTKAQGTTVTYPSEPVRIAADTALPLDAAGAEAVGLPVGTLVCDLTRLLPVPTGGGVPIVVGPRGPEGPEGPAGVADDASMATVAADPDSEFSGEIAAKIATAKSWARNPDMLIAGAVTRDSNGAATSAPVVWPDGSPGTYTADALSDDFTGAVDGYHITYGSPVTKTFTQPTITRDSTGAAITVPQIVVS